MAGSPDGTRRTFSYVRLLEALQHELATRREGSRLPSEAVLASRYGVSRMTARRAMLALREEGLVSVAPRRGVFIAGRKIDLHEGPATLGFSARTRAAGLVPSARLLRFERAEAGVAGARALQVPVGSPVYAIERLRHADGTPMVHERTIVPVTVCPSLYRFNLEHDSLYRILTEVHGLRPASVTEQIDAAIAGRGLARLFRGSPSDPVLVVRRVLLDDTGRPLEFTTATHRGDRYRATYRLQGGSESTDRPEPA